MSQKRRGGAWWDTMITFAVTQQTPQVWQRDQQRFRSTRRTQRPDSPVVVRLSTVIAGMNPLTLPWRHLFIFSKDGEDMESSGLREKEGFGKEKEASPLLFTSRRIDSDFWESCCGVCDTLRSCREEGESQNNPSARLPEKNNRKQNGKIKNTRQQAMLENPNTAPVIAPLSLTVRCLLTFPTWRLTFCSNWITDRNGFRSSVMEKSRQNKT